MKYQNNRDSTGWTIKNMFDCWAEPSSPSTKDLHAIDNILFI